ncbi:MAG TPA: protease complex subunit PrcB family protein [Longimicrobium sp.]
MSRIASLMLASLLLTAACGKSAPLGPEGSHSTRPADESLAFARLRTEPYPFTFNSGLTDSARVVVRDARAWEAIWRDVWRNHTPVPALPAIDFEREMVVVAALGSRRSGGYGILVEGATRTAEGVEVSILKQSPGSRCGNTAAITTPVDIARLRRVDGAVRFRERNEVRECR